MDFLGNNPSPYPGAKTFSRDFIDIRVLEMGLPEKI
jgi:hypothetical protein